MANIEIFDDDRTFSTGMATIFEAFGYSVRRQHTLNDALWRVDELRCEDALPDLLLVDGNYEPLDESCEGGRLVLNQLGSLSICRNVELDVVSTSSVSLHEAYDVAALSTRFPGLRLHAGSKDSVQLLELDIVKTLNRRAA